MRRIFRAAALLAAFALAGCSGVTTKWVGPYQSPGPGAAAANGQPAPVDSTKVTAYPSAYPLVSPARPTAKPVPGGNGGKVSSVTVSLAQPGQSGFCATDGVQAELRWVVKVDSDARTPVRMDIQSTDGLLVGSENIEYVVENGLLAGSRRHTVTWDKAHPRRTVEYWIQTTSPNRVQSSRVKFTIDCTTAG
ncbi:hypothetical protein [Dactylosporangium sp. CS-033363]|uniref:hypothetical protein n=1 Tax=Dactylosporangium sp. CS-033363 TaxID=3239935 RepID=UPI003D92D766